MSEAQPQQNQQIQKEGLRDAIYIGKKPLMAYVTSTLIQLANQPTVTIKARGLSIGRAVDVSQIILKRMENAGYKIGDGTELAPKQFSQRMAEPEMYQQLKSK